MRPECSVSCLQRPDVGSYPESNESKPHPPKLPPQDPFRCSEYTDQSGLFPSRFSTRILHAFLMFDARYMPRRSHYDYPYNIWWSLRVTVVKLTCYWITGLFVVQFCLPTGRWNANTEQLATLLLYIVIISGLLQSCWRVKIWIVSRAISGLILLMSLSSPLLIFGGILWAKFWSSRCCDTPCFRQTMMSSFLSQRSYSYW